MSRRRLFNLYSVGAAVTSFGEKHLLIEFWGIRLEVSAGAQYIGANGHQM